MIRGGIDGRFLKLVLVLTCGALCSVLLNGCDLQPKGFTVFKVEGKVEYDRATLKYPESDEVRPPLKLKWSDTNTYVTTATFAPGRYLFQARSSEGLAYAREVAIQPDIKRYVLPAATSGASVVSKGPELKGRATLETGETPKNLAVLFIAQDLTVRRVSAADGVFVTESPGPGKYRVEVHALGSPPKSFVRDNVSIASPVDLGQITLR